MSATRGSTSNRSAGRLLRESFQLIWDEQLTNGEIPSYRRMNDESWQYCFSPFVSAYVYAQLSPFDPVSPFFEPLAMEAADADWRHVMLRGVVQIRRKIRQFLAWQETSAGNWRFFGLGSPLPADLDLTACAAAVFLDPLSGRIAEVVDRRRRAIENFAAGDGSFHSPGSREEADGGTALMWMANCNALRYLSLGGGETELLEATIANAVASGVSSRPDSLPFHYAAARAWRQGRLENSASITSQLLPDTIRLGRQCKGPLSAVLAFLAMLDLDAPANEMTAAAGTVLQWWSSPRERKLEDCLCPRFGSPALTAAFTMAAVARGNVVIDW